MFNNFNNNHKHDIEHDPTTWKLLNNKYSLKMVFFQIETHRIENETSACKLDFCVVYIFITHGTTNVNIAISIVTAVVTQSD